MALGVMVLALDRIAPVVRHLQEARLQRGISALDLRHPMLGLEA